MRGDDAWNHQWFRRFGFVFRQRPLGGVAFEDAELGRFWWWSTPSHFLASVETMNPPEREGPAGSRCAL